MSPLLDQELAGFLAKLSTIAVLWTVAFVIMTRAETAGEDTDPLVWSDVEREIRARRPPRQAAGVARTAGRRVPMRVVSGTSSGHNGGLWVAW